MNFYKAGSEHRLMQLGISKQAAARLAASMSANEKEAEFEVPEFISDYFTNYDGSINWKNILIPAALMSATGLLTYKAGINGHPKRSFGENFRNYTIGGLRNMIREISPRSMYGNPSKYINYATPK